MIRYVPEPSVMAERTFSISAGLEASTVTPGSTAPDVSLTTPSIDACANADAGRMISQARTNSTLRITRIDSPLLRVH